MKQNPAGASFALPDEYRMVAENLFSRGGSSPAQSLAAAASFADALGIGAEYRRLLEAGSDASVTRKLLGHFQNNLALLIQKTWVEKTDEARKEKLQDKLAPFMEMIARGDLPSALGEFAAILEELAYLLFGEQSTGDDFAEYTFRIDIEMGLFWWYASRLGEPGAGASASDEFLWALLLIGVCYLTNF